MSFCSLFPSEQEKGNLSIENRTCHQHKRIPRPETSMSHSMKVRLVLKALCLILATLEVRAFTAGNLKVDRKSLASSRKSHREDASIDSFSTERRHAIKIAGSSLFGLLLGAQPSHAGEVGARITKVVTTSDLGISVRRSVVQGAQLIDKADGKWELFSDKYGLGAERSKQEGRPKQKVIPDPKPLNVPTALKILDVSDDAFISCTGIQQNDLKQRIKKIDGLVRPSFERSGLQLNEDGSLSTGSQFNYASYVHYRAYTEYLIESKTSFPKFRRDFDSQVGQQIASLLLSDFSKSSGSNSQSKEASLNEGLSLSDQLCDILVNKGLIAATDRSDIDTVRLEDWIEDLGDLQLDIALDGDITLNAQTLLQEQGFRLYPSYGRVAIQHLLSTALPQQKVSIEEYYMDTNYNSNPDLFEVREILLNVVLDSY